MLAVIVPRGLWRPLHPDLGVSFVGRAPLGSGLAACSALRREGHYLVSHLQFYRKLLVSAFSMGLWLG